MKTKPLKALEPGFRKKTPNDLIMWIIAACIIISIIETIGFKEKIRQQSAIIARQQLIIDTLKADSAVYLHPGELTSWDDTTSYIVDHSEIKRDQEGD